MSNTTLERKDGFVETTKALRWTFRKRAFSVSGSFRKKLSDIDDIFDNADIEEKREIHLSP